MFGPDIPDPIGYSISRWASDQYEKNVHIFLILLDTLLELIHTLVYKVLEKTMIYWRKMWTENYFLLEKQQQELIQPPQLGLI